MPDGSSTNVPINQVPVTIETILDSSTVTKIVVVLNSQGTYDITYWTD
jgi:hypothetical protein